jgi:hypothetical protein
MITVRVAGHCPNGHLVFYNLPITIARGSHGLATAAADCPACTKAVHLTGTY